MLSKNSEKPLVTVIICNFNYGDFLSDAFQSVVQQSFPRLELIFYDDGSSDGSVSTFCEQLAFHADRFERTVSIFSKVNKGKLHGLNETLPQAKGEFVVILDSDDELMSDYIELSVNNYFNDREQDENIGFVYSDCVLIDHHGQQLAGGTSEPFDANLLKTQSYIPECALTRTSALTEQLPFDDSIKKLTKHHKWLKVVRAGWTGVYLNAPGFRYRMHDRNMSNIGNRVMAEMGSGTKNERILSDYWDVGSSNV